MSPHEAGREQSVEGDTEGQERPHVLKLPSWYPAAHAPINGIFAKEQAQALARHGFEVGAVYAERRSPRTQLTAEPLLASRFQKVVARENGIHTVRRRGWMPLGLHKLQARFWVRQTLGLVDSYIERFGRPDIVHAHAALWGGVAARAVRRRHGIAYVITEHSSGYARGLMQPWHRPLLEEAFADAGAVMAVSVSLAASMEPYMAGRAVEVVPNVIDTDFFTLRADVPPKEPLRFLTVGMLDRKKGVDVLLEALAALQERGVDARLEVGGDGEERGRLEARAGQLGLGDRARFLGPLDRGSVRKAMQAAHCFVVASRHETFSIVAAEALASGVPVVATRSGGPETFVGAEDGVLVEVEDAAGLADAMAATASRSFDGAAARARVVECFGAEALAGRLSRVYRRVLREQVT